MKITELKISRRFNDELWLGIVGSVSEGEDIPNAFIDAHNMLVKTADTMYNRPSFEGFKGIIPTILNVDKLNAVSDDDFENFKKEVEAFKTKDQAMLYLQASNFKLSIEAKNYINQKFN